MEAAIAILPSTSYSKKLEDWYTKRFSTSLSAINSLELEGMIEDAKIPIPFGEYTSSFLMLAPNFDGEYFTRHKPEFADEKNVLYSEYSAEELEEMISQRDHAESLSHSD